MEYRNRIYRGHFCQDGRKGFVVKYKESDLWMGVDALSYQPEMPQFCDRALAELRTGMEAYLKKDPAYQTALAPYEAQVEAPEIFQKMSEAGRATGIGPMSAVAGAVSQYLAKALKREYRVKEVIAENGGDIYADLITDMDVAVFAGASPLSEKVGLHIPASDTPLGICTSSGTVGPSLSFGKADAVMIICKDVLLADSYATAFANQVQTGEDIQPVLEKIGHIKNILSAMLIKDDQMGVIGKYEIKLFK